ncbi:MAG: hypothetical protein JO217_03925 [Acidobacteriaceae bacterium]|nr:hypothetical protein [Acidobacteriaceae bacterium]
MEFCLTRAGKSLVATGAFALITTLVSAPGAANAQAAGAQQQPAAGQQPAGGQQQSAKNWKDRAEYDLYVKITQTTDPKARLELLNTWQDKYPQTDYSQERNQFFLVTLNQLAATDPSSRQKLVDKASEVLKTDPKNFTAMYFIALRGPSAGGASPSPDLVSTVESGARGVIENADAQFDPSKKPANVSDADFAKAKKGALGVAHNALAWAATTKKDTATAENEYKASLQADPDQGGTSAAYAQMLYTDKKIPEALFEYARAGEYAGPGPSLPADQRAKLLDFYNKAYTQYHGSSDGSQQLLDQAKTAALPPDNLNISSQAAQAQQQANAMQQRIDSDPAFKMWYSIKQSLTGDTGDQFFANMKGAEVPGGAEGVKDFTGTVITIDPPDAPTKVTLGVEDPTKADTTLVFSKPLNSAALDKIKVGNKLDFSGVAESYTKDPYMLTFTDPTIPGVQTTAPPKTGTRRRTGR